MAGLLSIRIITIVISLFGEKRWITGKQKWRSTSARLLSFWLLLQTFRQLLFFQYLNNKTYRGVGWWVLGSSMAAVGYVLLIMQDTNPILFIILANTLLILGAVSIYIGITRFLEQKENRWIIIAILAVFLIAFFYHTYGNNDITIRTVVFSVTLAIFSFLTALSLLENKIRSISTSANLIAAVFLAYGVFFIFLSLIHI